MAGVISAKERFLYLINSISEERLPEENKTRLINWLENKSDFFEAPASTKYHANFQGGLCYHSLNVYDVLTKLVWEFLPHKIIEVEVQGDESTDNQVEKKEIPYYSDDTIKLVALFHDISKANYYETFKRNVKNEKGEWIQVEEYRTISPDDRFIYGNHEQTSEFMVRTFVDLTIEESIAILNHHGGMGYDSAQTDISIIFNKYPLALLLHQADMIATYLLENDKHNEN